MKVKFEDLSGWLKFSAIISFILAGVWTLYFVYYLVLAIVFGS